MGLWQKQKHTFRSNGAIYENDVKATFSTPTMTTPSCEEMRRLWGDS